MKLCHTLELSQALLSTISFCACSIIDLPGSPHFYLLEHLGTWTSIDILPFCFDNSFPHEWLSDLIGYCVVSLIPFFLATLQRHSECWCTFQRERSNESNNNKGTGKLARYTASWVPQRSSREAIVLLWAFLLCWCQRLFNPRERGKLAVPAAIQLPRAKKREGRGKETFYRRVIIYF